MDEPELNEDDKLLHRNQTLLQSIAEFDFATYQTLTSDDLTGIEPGQGPIGRKKAFHRQFYDIVGSDKAAVAVSVESPTVRFLSNTSAIVSYVRKDQIVLESGDRRTIRKAHETRIWEKPTGEWINCHYHQSQ